jgi:FlaA1/EpsC-like NDP-sugar epimerase
MTDLHIQRLLGREEIQIDPQEIAAYLEDQVVMVTGAGGSIGSELCRQIARFKPSTLLLLGRGEQSIYEIHLECRARFPDLSAIPVIADIRDPQRIRHTFEEYRPAVIFHAAAHKNVEMIEAFPEEVVKNNIIGTQTVSNLANEYGVSRFLMISTDKAVRPASVYGAGKRISELQLVQLSRNSATVFVTVRFGNVLGARGSIVPLFQKQIREGGPVTVHPEATRYFMSLPEAARLVVQSGAVGTNGQTFILDMGEPTRILDLASEMIRLAGLEPGVDIEMKPIELRPGDKLHEELLTRTEALTPTKHPKISAAQPEDNIPACFDLAISEMKDMADRSDRVGIVRRLQELLPDYRPSDMWVPGP